MRALVLLIALLPVPAFAQTVAGQDLSAISAAAQAAQQKANAAMAAIPPICSTTPAKDTLSGSVGSTGACTPQADSTRPTAVQAINTTLAADCSWSVTYARATTSAAPIVHATAKLASGASMPIPCSPITISSTGAGGKCFPAQTTALNLNIVTAGVTVAPFGATCTAGMTIMVNVREPTQ